MVRRKRCANLATVTTMSVGVPSFHGSRRTKPNLCSAISRFGPVLAEELITDAETVGVAHACPCSWWNLSQELPPVIKARPARKIGIVLVEFGSGLRSCPKLRPHFSQSKTRYSKSGGPASILERLARLLLLLANFGKEGSPQPISPKLLRK
jgi:hypothetical protein